MGDGTEPIPQLTTKQLQQYQRQVMFARSPRELDRLTRLIWNAFESQKSAAAFGQLGAAVTSNRDTLKRNDPR